MRRNINVEPSKVETWTDVDGNSAKISGKVSYCRFVHRQEEYISNDPEDVSDEDNWTSNLVPVRNSCCSDEDDSSEEIDWYSEIIALQSIIMHCRKNAG